LTALAKVIVKYAKNRKLFAKAIRVAYGTAYSLIRMTDVPTKKEIIKKISPNMNQFQSLGVKHIGTVSYFILAAKNLDAMLVLNYISAL